MDSSYIVCKFACMLLLYAVFLKSFFPIRTGLTGFSEKSDFSSEIFNNNASFHPEIQSVSKHTVFKKMVFILIDALRADFVFNNQSPMTSLQNLWTKGKLIRYIARVHPPTVTLPRIKALTTGSIPGFVDVVLNFGSSELYEDNIIDQMKRAGKRVMFYGDDTWIKLFPHHFVDSDGTTSFFVTDYTEVDNNVTRHVLPTLQAGQFDVLILHYLGLDHIGHLAGPTSYLVPPKLQEMDSIIRDIYQHVEQNTEVDTLIVVCGDHGMSDQGAMVGPHLVRQGFPSYSSAQGLHRTQSVVDEGIKEVDQVDVAPTLSVLLDLPIPRNNLGLIIDDALEGFSTEEKVMVFWKNALQVSKLLKYNNPDYDIDEGYVEFQRLSKVHRDWLMSRTSGISNSDWLAEGDKIGRQYIMTIKIMSKNISSSLLQYDIYSLIVAVVTLWLILATLGLQLYLSPAPKERSLSKTIILSIPVTLTILLGHVMVCTTHSGQLCRTDPFGLLLQSLILSVVCGSAAELVVNFIQFWSIRRTKVGPSGHWGMSCPLGVGLTLGTVSHTLSLLSSSYVEEEHQTWYFYTVTVHLAIVVLILRTYTSSVVTAHRLVHPPDPAQYQDLTCDKYSANHSDTEQKYSNDNNDTGKGDKCKERERKNNDLEWRKGLHGHPVMAVMLVLILCRVLRTWNQTGNKWLETPDVGDWLIRWSSFNEILRSENKCVLSVLVGGALCVVAMVKWAGQSCMQRFLFVLGLCFIYWYRVSTGAVDNPFQLLSTDKGTWLAQLVFVCIGLCMLHPLIPFLVRGFQADRKPNQDEAIRFCVSVQSGCILLVLLLSKPHNVAMFVMVVIQEHIVDSVVLRHLSLPPTTVTLYYLWMGVAAFFYQGNSNSISTVDVSAGYTGLTDYQPVLVSLLIALSTYGCPVFWLVSLVKHLTATVDPDHVSFYTRLKTLIEAVCGTLCWSRALPLAVYSGLVTLQRHHLFVWTVFSPKLLYEGVFTIILAAFSISCLFLVKIKI